MVSSKDSLLFIQCDGQGEGTGSRWLMFEQPEWKLSSDFKWTIFDDDLEMTRVHFSISLFLKTKDLNL